MAKAKKAVQKETVVVESQTAKNRARRLAKHQKAHPNDKQAARASATPAVRKKPKTKGNYPAKVVKIRDAAGHVVHAGPIYGAVPEVPRKREEIMAEKQPFYDFMVRGVASFGNIKPTEDQIKENVKALCFGLGIQYTGRRAGERKGNRVPGKGNKKKSPIASKYTAK